MRSQCGRIVGSVGVNTTLESWPKTNPMPRHKACLLSVCSAIRYTCNYASTKWLRFAKTRIFFHPTLSPPKNRGDYTPLATRCREQTAAADCRPITPRRISCTRDSTGASRLTRLAGEVQRAPSRGLGSATLGFHQRGLPFVLVRPCARHSGWSCANQPVYFPFCPGRTSHPPSDERDGVLSPTG